MNRSFGSNYRPAPDRARFHVGPTEAMLLGERLRERHATVELNALEILEEIRDVARLHGADYRDVRFGYIATNVGRDRDLDKKAA